MNDPMVAIAGVTGVLGLWTLLVGRPFRNWPYMALDTRTFRLTGAYSVVVSLVVIALALGHHDGIAFLTYAALSLLLVVTTQVLSNRKQAS
jgi:hypothetical protein